MECKLCGNKMDLVDSDPELGKMWECQCGSVFILKGPGNAFDESGWKVMRYLMIMKKNTVVGHGVRLFNQWIIEWQHDVGIGIELLPDPIPKSAFQAWIKTGLYLRYSDSPPDGW